MSRVWKLSVVYGLTITLVAFLFSLIGQFEILFLITLGIITYWFISKKYDILGEEENKLINQALK